MLRLDVMTGPPEGFNPPAVEGQGDQLAKSENPTPGTDAVSGSTESKPHFPEVDRAALKHAEEREKARVREQLGTVRQEFVQTKAQEAAKQQIAKETRGLPWWQRAAQSIRLVPSVLTEQKTFTGQRTQEYTRDYERREELENKLATMQLGDKERVRLQTELEGLKTKLSKGQGVELTEQEQRLFNDLQQIIATKRGELDLEDQKLKDRAEAGKILEFLIF